MLLQEWVHGEGHSLFGIRRSIWTFECRCAKKVSWRHNWHYCPKALDTPSTSNSMKDYSPPPTYSNTTSNSSISSSSSSSSSDAHEEYLTCSSSKEKEVEDVYETATSVATLTLDQALAVTMILQQLAQEENKKYTDFSEFKRFIETNQLILRSKQCRHGVHCYTKYCTFGHSVMEMVALFADPRIKYYYSEVATVLVREYVPRNPKNLEVATSDKFCCSPRCHKDNVSLKIILYDQITHHLVYPYLVLHCTDCRKVTNVPIYQ